MAGGYTGNTTLPSTVPSGWQPQQFGTPQQPQTGGGVNAAGGWTPGAGAMDPVSAWKAQNPQAASDPALQSWMKANPGQTPNLPSSFTPNPSTTTPAPTQNSGTTTPLTPGVTGDQTGTGTGTGTQSGLGGMDSGYQPFDAYQTRQMLNQANADTQATGAGQVNDLRNRMAGSGFGMNSPAELGQRTGIMGQTARGVAQNQYQIPMQNALYNAQFGTGVGQLGALQQQNQFKEQLGGMGLQNQLLNAILGFAKF